MKNIFDLCFITSPRGKIALILILSLLGLGVYKDATSIYPHSWVYGTFIQPGFNADITVKVYFDGKPYTIHRILRCHQEIANRWAYIHFSHPDYIHSEGFYADYSAFGTKAATGEGIIVTIPDVCTANQTPAHNGNGEAWIIPIPPDYIPLLSVEDSVDNPKKIIVYASRQAYKSPNVRLLFNGMEIKSPTGKENIRFFADGADQFSFFGRPPQEYRGKKTEWSGFSFVKIPKEIWQEPTSWGAAKEVWDTEERKWHPLNEFIENLKQTKEPQEFNHPDWAAIGDYSSKMWGISGIYPGPFLKSEAVHYQTVQFLLGHPYFDQMIPYRLENGIWEPDPDNQGRYILYNSATASKNDVYVRTEEYEIHRETTIIPSISNTGKKIISARKIKFGNEDYDYQYSSAIGFPSFPAFYSPANQSIFMPMPADASTYPLGFFK